MRMLSFIVIGIGLASSHSLAQPEPVALATSTNQTPALSEAAAGESWSFSASSYTYFVPDSSDYVQPTFTADRNWLHLEARYNYEALDTGSAWLGYNYSTGEKLSLEFTPLLGAVFGDTTGIATGYKFTLGWWMLELYSEGEYLFDTDDSRESFFYTWSELTVSPVDWFRFGVVIQRTKLYETNFDIQRGFLVGFSSEHFAVNTYVLNPDDDPTVVLGLTVNF